MRHPTKLALALLLLACSGARAQESPVVGGLAAAAGQPPLFEIADLPACDLADHGKLFRVSDASAPNDCTVGLGTLPNTCQCNGNTEAYVDVGDGVGTGTPGGAANAAQYNSAGVLGGDNMFLRVADGQWRVYNTTATTGVSLLSVRAGAGQAASRAVEFLNNAGAARIGVDLNGNLSLGDPLDYDARLHVVALAATDVAAIFRAAASQSANLVQFESSVPATLSAIDASGNFTGRAATALAASANPGNCGAGLLPRGIAADFTGEGCAALDLAAEVAGSLPHTAGGVGGTTAPDDNLLVGAAAGNAWERKLLPTCNLSTQKLHYTPATNAFSCEVDQNTGGGALTYQDLNDWKLVRNADTSILDLDLTPRSAFSVGQVATAFAADVAIDISAGTGTAALCVSVDRTIVVDYPSGGGFTFTAPVGYTARSGDGACDGGERSKWTWAATAGVWAATGTDFRGEYIFVPLGGSGIQVAWSGSTGKATFSIDSAVVFDKGQANDIGSFAVSQATVERLTSGGLFRAADGADATVSFGWASDPNSGWRSLGNDQPTFVVGGARRIDFSTTQALFRDYVLAFEGATIDGTNIASFAVTDPTAPRTFTLPNTSGEVSLLGQTISLAETLATALLPLSIATNQLQCPTCSAATNANTADLRAAVTDGATGRLIKQTNLSTNSGLNDWTVPGILTVGSAGTPTLEEYLTDDVAPGAHATANMLNAYFDRAKGERCFHRNGQASAQCYSSRAIVPIAIPDPATGDSGKVQIKFPSAVTITRISCSTLGATATVTIQFDERGETTPNTAGVDVMSATLPCDNDNQATTAFANPLIAANAPLNLDVDAVANSPTAVRIFVEIAW